MSKSVVKNYTFDTVARTVTFTDFTTVSLDRLALITDVTHNVLLFNFTDPSLSTATVVGNVVTLSALPAGLDNSDKLRIDYNATTGDPTYDPVPVLAGGGATAANQATEIADLQTISTVVPVNTWRDGFSSQDSTKWDFTNKAASDLIYTGGNVAAASWVAICKSALVADTYSEIVSKSSYPFSLFAAAGDVRLPAALPPVH